jgi:hypothetical protein
VLLQAWLEKQAVSAPWPLKNWKHRYITLLTDRIEWRRQLNEAPAGWLRIIPTTRVAQSSDGARRMCLKITTDGTTLTLSFCTEAELQSWAGALGSAVSGRMPTAVAQAVPMPQAQPMGGAVATAYPTPKDSLGGPTPVAQQTPVFAQPAGAYPGASAVPGGQAVATATPVVISGAAEVPMGLPL